MQNYGEASADSSQPTYSQKGKQLLVVDSHIFYHNKTYIPKNVGTTKLYWQCERRKDLGCGVTAVTDARNNVVRAPATPHIHAARNGMYSIKLWIFSDAFSAAV